MSQAIRMTIDLPLALRPKVGRTRCLSPSCSRVSATIVAPGAFDCISARLVETAGFPAVYVTGSGVSMSILGAPDIGVVSFKEVVEHVGRIADLVSIPVIADADTGYGGVVNIFRTVREFERAGVSAIQIEDQEWPKRCGHEPGRRLVSAADMEARVRAAVAARQDPTLRSSHAPTRAPMRALMRRSTRINRYRDAGADILFVESPESETELERIVREAPGVHLANMVEGGRTPVLGVDSAERPGVPRRHFPKFAHQVVRTHGRGIVGRAWSHGKHHRLSRPDARPPPALGSLRQQRLGRARRPVREPCVECMKTVCFRPCWPRRSSRSSGAVRSRHDRSRPISPIRQSSIARLCAGRVARGSRCGCVPTSSTMSSSPGPCVCAIRGRAARIPTCSAMASRTTETASVCGACSRRWTATGFAAPSR